MAVPCMSPRELESDGGVSRPLGASLCSMGPPTELPSLKGHPDPAHGWRVGRGCSGPGTHKPVASGVGPTRGGQAPPELPLSGPRGWLALPL